MTDGGDRRAMIKARLTGVTDRELEETYGRLEETGGCGRRTLGRLMGGWLADVASQATDSSCGFKPPTDWRADGY